MTRNRRGKSTESFLFMAGYFVNVGVDSQVPQGCQGRDRRRPEGGKGEAEGRGKKSITDLARKLYGNPIISLQAEKKAKEAREAAQAAAAAGMPPPPPFSKPTVCMEHNDKYLRFSYCFRSVSVLFRLPLSPRLARRPSPVPPPWPLHPLLRR